MALVKQLLMGLHRISHAWVTAEHLLLRLQHFFRDEPVGQQLLGGIFYKW